MFLSQALEERMFLEQAFAGSVFLAQEFVDHVILVHTVMSAHVYHVYQTLRVDFDIFEENWYNHNYHEYEDTVQATVVFVGPVFQEYEDHGSYVLAFADYLVKTFVES
jgi:hypothetical protein